MQAQTNRHFEVKLSTMTEWFVTKINRFGELSDVHEKKELLTEIKIKLLSLSNRELEPVAGNLDLGKLFSQLTSHDSAFVDELCDVIKIVIIALEPGDVHQRYPREVFQFISHSDVRIKNLVLEELLRTASSPTKLKDYLLKDTDLLVAVVERVADEDLSVAKYAMSILKKIGETSEGLQVLYSGTLLRTLARLLSKNDIISFRVYDVITDISKSTKIGLEASVKSGFLHSLIAILENEDELLHLNVLEEITGLAVTEEGLHFLEQQDVLRKLAHKIARANETPLSNLLIPGLMKFFGHVARFRPNEIFSKYPVVVSALFEVLESADQIILASALDTLGHIATTVEGKYALQDLGDNMSIALKRIAEVIKKMPTDLRVRGLNNLACILDVKRSEQDNRILSLTKSWFDLLCEEPLEMVVDLCKQPFADIRQASLELLAVLASQVWGQEYIAAFPGLVEFLLDRNIESFKECKEAKYDVVRNLSNAVSDIFDANNMQRFKQFVNQGPMYVETQIDVATESAA